MSETVDIKPDPITPSTPPSNVVGLIIYVLYLVTLLIPFAGLIAVIMAYINRGSGSAILDSHYHFQIRTFWIGLLFITISFVLTYILIGWLLLFLYIIWLIIRCAKGIKALNQQQAVANPTSWKFGEL